MKSKIGIVIEREYRTRVFKKSFILMTLLIPILFAVISALPAILISTSSDEQIVAVIDKTGKYLKLFEGNEDYTFVSADRSMADYKAMTKDQQEDSDITAILEIRQDLKEDPKAITLFSFKTLPPGLENYIRHTLSEYVTNEKRADANIPGLDEIIRSSKTEVTIGTYKLEEGGAETATSGDIATAIGMILAIMIYMYVSIYGGMVLQGVMEEKKNRIVEVMVSSVKPFDLMMGKIIGIGLVGMTQIFIWIVLLSGIGMFAPMLLSAPSATATMSGDAPIPTGELANIQMMLSSINFVEIGVLFLLYVIGGFLLYSSIYAGLGSAINNDEDAQQIMMPVMILLILSCYIGIAAAGSPESSLAVWASYIPFTSPVAMMVRIPFGVSLWEEVLSIVVLYVSFIGAVYIGGKIYRIGILMYGKKPSFKEIWRWLRY